ncbi:MAG: EamA family transporter, partial [Candidatus Nanohaloarchaea archaeon]
MALSAGVLFGIVAMIGYGFADFFVERATREEDVFDILLWSKVVSTALLGIALAFLFQPARVTVSGATLILVAGLLNVAAYLAFYRGIQVGKLSIVSPVASAWGAVTAIIGVFLLGQILTGIQSAAVGAVVAGTVLASFRWNDLAGRQWDNYETGIEYGAVALLSWGISFAIIDILVGQIGWVMAIFLVLLVLLVTMGGYAGATGR